MNEPAFQNKEFAIGGIVTRAEERMSKNGRPWGLLAIEDFSGMHEMRLFGDDFLKFKSYCQPELFLYIKGKMQADRWSREGETPNFEFRPGQIMLLNDLRKTKCEKISVELPIALVTEELIRSLHRLVQQNPGGCQLFVAVTDPDSPVAVTMQSRSARVDVSDQLLHGLESLIGKEAFKLN